MRKQERTSKSCGTELGQFVSSSSVLEQNPWPNDLFLNNQQFGILLLGDPEDSSAWVMDKGSISLSSKSVVELDAGSTLVSCILLQQA